MKDIYYPDLDHFRNSGNNESTDQKEPPVQPHIEPHIDAFDRSDYPQRLDSIAEESETSDNSLQSSNSNHNLPEYPSYFVPCTPLETVIQNHSEATHMPGGNRPVVVHMDMDQPIDLDSSNDTGSFEGHQVAEVSPNYEESIRLSQKTSFQDSSFSIDSVFDPIDSESDVFMLPSRNFDQPTSSNNEYLSLGTSSTTAMNRPTSPTPLSKDSQLGWTHQYSRDWHTSEDDSAQGKGSISI